MSNKATEKPTSTSTPTNWFANIGGQFLQLTAAAFNSLIGSLIGTQTHAATAKTTLVDADELPISDSAASNATKKITWADLWVNIKAKGDAVYAALTHSHSAADLTSGTVPDARFPSTLPALNGSNLTNLNAAALTSGTIDVARIPLLYSGVQVVSSGAIADLTSPQQATVTGGAIVTTTDGRRWIYKGSGGKTTEASYIETADVTPEWSVIANKPSTFAPPAPTTSVMGGVKRNAGSSGQFVKGIDTDGALIYDTPAGGGGGGSALVRGSGQLKGNTTPHGSPTVASGFINAGFGGGGGTLSIEISGTTFVITFAEYDPSDGSTYVNNTAFSGAGDYAYAFESWLNSVLSGWVTNVYRSEFYITFDGVSAGSSMYLNLATTMGGVSISGYTSGTDGSEGYGAVTEVEIIPAVSGKTILPVRVFVNSDGGISGMTVELSLKYSGAYYPLCEEFSSTISAAELLVGAGYAPIGSYTVRWINGLFQGSLVARLIGSPVDGGTMTIYAICEQN